MKTDYPELEGKVVNFVESNILSFNVVVVGCSYHVGITLALEKQTRASKKGRIVFCLIRKIAMKSVKPNALQQYREIFFYLVEDINAGEIVISRYLPMLPLLNRTSSEEIKEHCPFGQ